MNQERKHVNEDSDYASAYDTDCGHVDNGGLETSQLLGDTVSRRKRSRQVVVSGKRDMKDRPLSETGGLFNYRHVMAGLAFLGFVNVYALRVNLSVALMAMVNSTSKASRGSNSTEDSCPALGGGNATHISNRGEFDWDENTQGLVLGAFFYGYIVTQLPGGWLAARFGGKRLFGGGVLCTAVLSLLTPVAVRTHVYLFVALRVLEGIGEGVTFPAMHAMWGHWAPVWERSYLLAFSYSGSQLGTVISLPLSGLMCDSDFLGGWPSVFYVFGAAGCVWCLVWLLLTHDTPTSHPRISVEERDYILASVGDTTYRSPPWRQIFSSPAVWAITITHFTSNWGFNTLLTSLPQYMGDILKLDMTQNGNLSALPYAAMLLLGPTSGILADSLRRRHVFSTLTVRKIFNTVGLLTPASMLLLTGYVGCDHTLAILCLTLAIGGAGICYGGFSANHLDLSPRYAGILLGITNTAATIPGFAGPALVGYLTNGNNTRAQWRIVFYVAACIYMLGTIVYFLFASGEEQSWSQGPDQEDDVVAKDDKSNKSVAVIMGSEERLLKQKHQQSMYGSVDVQRAMVKSDTGTDVVA